MAIGVAIEFVLLAAHGTRPIAGAQTWALDTAMRFKAGAAQRPDPLVPPLALVDVDAQTWRDSSWGGGEPARAPRDRLLELVHFALEHQARYVIVDIAIEEKPEVDARFATSIGELIPALNERDQYLLFVRTLRQPLNTHPRLSPEWRPSALDSLGPSKRVLPVAPYFEVSPDGVTRDWVLWQGGCRRNGAEQRGRWQVLPSVQIVVAALQLAPHLQGAAMPWAQTQVGPPCIVSANALPAADLKSTAELTAGTNEELSRWLTTRSALRGYPELAEDAAHEHNWLNSRIFFTLPFPPRPDQAERLSALDVLGASAKSNGVDFGRGVVVVGQSFAEARDSYATPLGDMPGCLVMLNSVKSFIEHGPLRPPPAALQALLSTFMILAVSVLFTFLGTFLGLVAMAVSLIPFLLFASDRLLGLGYSLDFAGPLLGIALDRVVDATFGFAHEDREHWLGLLRPSEVPAETSPAPGAAIGQGAPPLKQETP